MQLSMRGKIDHTEFYNGNYITIITTPAPDAYSKPESFKLRSPNQLGAVGSEIAVTVSVRGYVRKKPYVDKSTGQQKTYWEENVFMDATLATSKPQPATPRQAKTA